MDWLGLKAVASDIGLEKDAPHLAESFLDVGFGQDATAAEPRKRGFQLLTELVKHSLQT